MRNPATESTARAPALEALRVNVIVGRARSRLSQEQLAERAAVSRPTISRIERGVSDVGITVIERIAKALDTTASALLVPVSRDRVEDEEIVRRSSEAESEFVDARAVLRDCVPRSGV